MLIPLLLGITLCYYYTSIPYRSHEDVLSKLKQLAQYLRLSDNARKRIDNMFIVVDKVTYTENKRIIHLCVNKDDLLFDKDTVLIAAIHELAHVIYDGNGHTYEFREIERELLDKALEKGMITKLLVNPSYPCSNV